MGVGVAFLDRDGTLNVEKGYMDDPADVELIPGAAQAVRNFIEAGYVVFGVSNQSGVARGYYTLEAAIEVNNRVAELLSAEKAAVREIFICPHHPEGVVAEYKVRCECRKPKIGMITAALEKYRLKPEKIIVVGDKACDVEMGKNAGARTALVSTGYGAMEMEVIKRNGGPNPDYYAKDVLEASRLLLA
jgi:histidinol-phosphate phosphatase family protein